MRNARHTLWAELIQKFLKQSQNTRDTGKIWLKISEGSSVEKREAYVVGGDNSKFLKRTQNNSDTGKIWLKISEGSSVEKREAYVVSGADSKILETVPEYSRHRENMVENQRGLIG